MLSNISLENNRILRQKKMFLSSVHHTISHIFSTIFVRVTAAKPRHMIRTTHRIRNKKANEKMSKRNEEHMSKDRP